MNNNCTIEFCEPIVVATSGYFNPLHKGHIEYLQKSRGLGHKLVVIVNNDHQVQLKGSKPFMDIKERIIILESLKYVDEVIESIDTDLSVCKTLEMLKPNIFAKGGDKFIKNIPEFEICAKLGIKIIDGLGNKIQSSSILLAQ